MDFVGLNLRSFFPKRPPWIVLAPLVGCGMEFRCWFSFHEPEPTPVVQAST
jgi:hypothetical protein